MGYGAIEVRLFFEEPRLSTMSAVLEFDVRGIEGVAQAVVEARGFAVAVEKDDDGVRA
jgi:hypothetical protein